MIGRKIAKTNQIDRQITLNKYFAVFGRTSTTTTAFKKREKKLNKLRYMRKK